MVQQLSRYPGGVLLWNSVKKKHFKKLIVLKLAKALIVYYLGFESFAMTLMNVFGQIRTLLNLGLPKEGKMWYISSGDKNEKLYRWKKRRRKTA